MILPIRPTLNIISVFFPFWQSNSNQIKMLMNLPFFLEPKDANPGSSQVSTTCPGLPNFIPPTKGLFECISIRLKSYVGVHWSEN
jgi:hypothetical protein